LSFWTLKKKQRKKKQPERSPRDKILNEQDTDFFQEGEEVAESIKERRKTSFREEKRKDRATFKKGGPRKRGENYSAQVAGKRIE